MSVGIAYHSEVTDDTTYIHRCFDQNVQLSSEFGNPIDVCARVALKPEVIETGFHFILNDDQNEDWIFSRGSCRTEPDIVPTLKPPITDDR